MMWIGTDFIFLPDRLQLIEEFQAGFFSFWIIKESIDFIMDFSLR